jgi:hypothetical protein
MAVTLETKVLAAVTVVASGALVTAGNNAISAAVDFTQGNAAVAGSARGKWFLSGTMSAAPTPPVGMTVYLIPSPDGGTTYATDPGRSTTPAQPAHAVIPLAAADNVAFVRDSPPVDGPAIFCKVIVVNGSAVSLGSGWSLQWVPITDQGV